MVTNSACEQQPLSGGWDSWGVGCRRWQSPSILGSLETTNPWKQIFTALSRLPCQSNYLLEIMQKCFNWIIRFGVPLTWSWLFFFFPCSTENFLKVSSIVHFWKINRTQSKLFLMGKWSVGNTLRTPFTNQNLLIIFTVHCKCRQPVLHLQCSDRLELLQTAFQKFIFKISHTFTVPSSWSLTHIYPTD